MTIRDQTQKRYDKNMELASCTFIRTILILFVVLSHSISFWATDWFHYYIQPENMLPLLTVIKDLVTHFILYGFVLVSGYIFSYAYLESGSNKKSYLAFKPYINNKAKRLLVPFYFVGIVWAIPFGFLFQNYTLRTALEKVILAKSPQQLWFLWMLFGVFILFWLLKRVFIEKPWFYGLILSLFMYLFGIIWGRLVGHYFQIPKTGTFVLFFWIGFQIRRYWGEMIRSISIFVWIGGYLLVLVISKVVHIGNGIIFTLLDNGVELVLNVIGSIMIFTVLQRIAEKVKWNENKTFLFLSANSMGVFLFHQQVIYVVITLLNGKINTYFIALLNFILSLAVSLLVCTILHKFKVAKFFIGEKT